MSRGGKSKKTKPARSVTPNYFALRLMITSILFWYIFSIEIGSSENGFLLEFNSEGMSKIINSSI